jgi:protein-S-isoprenylcysteine O-methyltransferase Ste14
MIAIYLYLFGLFAFVFGSLSLGVWLRKNRSEENAQRSSRIMQFLFFAALNLPPMIAVFYPGLSHLDDLVGYSSLSPRPLFLVIGIILALPGAYLLLAPNISLRKIGGGANAFRLTKNIVDSDLYSATRNPMSLGYYLTAIAVALISGSTLATFAVLFTLLPAHLFYLKYFEELELELRFGESYREYRQKVPFLVPRRLKR